MVFFSEIFTICAMASSTSKRNRISDSQRATRLEGFYDRGMVGTGGDYPVMIERAMGDTGLTKSQVQVLPYYTCW